MARTKNSRWIFLGFLCFLSIQTGVSKSVVSTTSKPTEGSSAIVPPGGSGKTMETTVSESDHSSSGKHKSSKTKPRGRSSQSFSKSTTVNKLLSLSTKSTSISLAASPSSLPSETTQRELSSTLSKSRTVNKPFPTSSPHSLKPLASSPPLGTSGKQSFTVENSSASHSLSTIYTTVSPLTLTSSHFNSLSLSSSSHFSKTLRSESSPLIKSAATNKLSIISFSSSPHFNATLQKESSAISNKLFTIFTVLSSNFNTRLGKSSTLNKYGTTKKLPLNATTPSSQLLTTFSMIPNSSTTLIQSSTHKNPGTLKNLTLTSMTPTSHLITFRSTKTPPSEKSSYTKAHTISKLSTSTSVSGSKPHISLITPSTKSRSREESPMTKSHTTNKTPFTTSSSNTPNMPPSIPLMPSPWPSFPPFIPVPWVTFSPSQNVVFALRNPFETKPWNRWFLQPSQFFPKMGLPGSLRNFFEFFSCQSCYIQPGDKIESLD